MEWKRDGDSEKKQHRSNENNSNNKKTFKIVAVAIPVIWRLCTAR